MPVEAEAPKRAELLAQGRISAMIQPQKDRLRHRLASTSPVGQLLRADAEFGGHLLNVTKTERPVEVIRAAMEVRKRPSHDAETDAS
ncbi:hypothetical protein BS642_21980 [Chromobacterium violaceum]|nr:hypothetical protein BS642_21980 [Chromobacterium violaceum]